MGLMHLDSHQHRKFGPRPACGIVSWRGLVNVTDDPDLVTCNRCKKTFALKQVKQRQTVKTKVSSIPIFKELK